MRPPTSRHIDRWRVIARRDWRRARVLLDDGDPEGAALFVQQCVEKLLKAYLLERGWELERIHVLGTLLTEASKHEPGLAEYLPMGSVLTTAYVRDRYPGLAEPTSVSEQEVEGYIEQARALVQLLFPDEVLP